MNKAAAKIHVSAGSLSKAISRLEDELQTTLFFRVGRGIKLTPEGQHFKARAAEIVNLEENVKLELQGRSIGSINVCISSEEILQTSYGISIIRKISKLVPRARMQFLIRSEATAIQQVMNGEAHMAIITQEVPQGVVAKNIAQVNFLACASKQHPILKGKALKKSDSCTRNFRACFCGARYSYFGQDHKVRQHRWLAR